MTRRRPKTTTHVHRVTKTTGTKSGLLQHRNRLLRRSSISMLARKNRNDDESDYTRAISRFVPRAERGSAAQAISTGSTSSNNSVTMLSPKSYTRVELINFWRELSLVAKRRLLRIRRDTFLSSLDEFLVSFNMCCECHDNVIAEWEDHERKRSGSRSKLDAFSDLVLEEEELVFRSELEREGRRGADGKGGMLSDEYLAALEVGKRQEDELLRLIQKEERYIIIREDHTDFIEDMIRCGIPISDVQPLPPGFDDDESENSEEDDEVDVDDTCPGANTSYWAQEYLLDVLGITFSQQLEAAYQEALQHSLAIQAELLRDELADLQASQKPSSTSRKKKSKKEKKRRKKEAAAQKATENVNPRDTNTQSHMSKRNAAASEKQQFALASTDGSADSVMEVRVPEEDDIDREVEQFRLLLEKINAESALRSRKKLVLPPGSFAHLTSMTVS
ncbi:uncharacterized protein PITG_18961 [Phytophthora infestans T30-4]|uniref:Uncharacterized protein n=1 Tax=Phytophthora infestans (strain T30-4) TaxID=403677 RepID=D0NZ75_PHYIT|nr:uncharacterized protein PITG_18961 [Phytophthora infestans T30-4]EEY68869.1 conserved hypothetical protein [Phytophthora infestans T30-4]|eukprot:XP_002997328.1 conserved hypothetical protein [Phytophthora infestans T30-4]